MNELIKKLLADPTRSNWFKKALKEALERDPVDAAKDARELANLLELRVDAILEGLEV